MKKNLLRKCIISYFPQKKNHLSVSKLLLEQGTHHHLGDYERRFDKRRNFVCFVKVLDDTPID